MNPCVQRSVVTRGGEGACESRINAAWHIFVQNKLYYVHVFFEHTEIGGSSRRRSCVWLTNQNARNLNRSVSVCMVYVCIYIYIYMYICMYIYKYVCVHIYLYMFVCIYVHVFRCIYLCVCVCIYIGVPISRI